MRGISCFVHILRDRNKLLRLKLTKLFPNINFSGEKDFGKVLIIIIILFLIIKAKFSDNVGHQIRRRDTGLGSTAEVKAHGEWRCVAIVCGSGGDST